MLVVGATGTIGRLVVSGLLAAGTPVRALSRRPEHADLPDAVEVVRGDLDDPGSLRAPFDGVDAVFLAATGDVARRDAAAAQAAAAAGAARIVCLSVVGAQDPERGRTTPARAHLDGEDAVTASGVPAVFVRPGAFMSNAFGWARQVHDGDTVRVPFADVPAAPVDPRDVADVAVRAMVGEVAAGRGLPVSGPEVLTPAEQVEVLGDALGRPLRCEPVPEEQVRRAMTERGTDPGLVEGLFAHLDEPRPEATVYDTVRSVTGRPATPFARWVADHRDAFSARPR